VQKADELLLEAITALTNSHETHGVTSTGSNRGHGMRHPHLHERGTAGVERLNDSAARLGDGEALVEGRRLRNAGFRAAAAGCGPRRSCLLLPSVHELT
jgi:hypothetical protein